MSLLIACAFAVTIFAGCNVNNTNSNINTSGNTSGNINNIGIAAQQGDWIYYSNYNGVDGDKIYKIKTDGTGKIELTGDRAFYINVAGDWIYYTNNDDGGKIYKIK